MLFLNSNRDMGFMGCRGHRIWPGWLFPSLQVFQEACESFKIRELVRINCQELSRLIIQRLIARGQNERCRLSCLVNDLGYGRLEFP